MGGILVIGQWFQEELSIKGRDNAIKYQRYNLPQKVKDQLNKNNLLQF